MMKIYDLILVIMINVVIDLVNIIFDKIDVKLI